MYLCKKQCSISMYLCYRQSTLREESSQTNVILQYKLLASILSSVCSVIQQSQYIFHFYYILYDGKYNCKIAMHQTIFQLQCFVLLNNHQYNCNITKSFLRVHRQLCHTCNIYVVFMCILHVQNTCIAHVCTTHVSHFYFCICNTCYVIHLYCMCETCITCVLHMQYRCIHCMCNATNTIHVLHTHNMHVAHFIVKSIYQCIYGWTQGGAQQYIYEIDKGWSIAMNL